MVSKNQSFYLYPDLNVTQNHLTVDSLPYSVHTVIENRCFVRQFAYFYSNCQIVMTGYANGRLSIRLGWLPSSTSLVPRALAQTVALQRTLNQPFGHTKRVAGTHSHTRIQDPGIASSRMCYSIRSHLASCWTTSLGLLEFDFECVI